MVVDKGFFINKLQEKLALKLKYIHDELESRAKAYGISICGLYNNSGLHDMATWTRGLADRHLIGLAGLQGGYGSVVPFGGTPRYFGHQSCRMPYPQTITRYSPISRLPKWPILNLQNIKRKQTTSQKCCPRYRRAAHD